MSVFTRELGVEQILQHVRERPEGAVAALFANWVPPGDRPKREGKLGLRLAVRSGYVNFYVNGQSVAKLTSSAGKFEIETHWKYHQGVHKGVPGSPEGKLYPRNGSARHVPLSQAAVEVIEALPKYKDCPLILANPETRARFVPIKRAWQTARREARLPGLRLHDLRHVAASFLVAGGVDLYTVGKILGHNDYKSTQRYAHLANDTLLAAVEAGAARLGAAGAQK